MVKKVLKIILFFVLIVFIIAGTFFFIGKPSQAEEIIWGVNFSHKHARDLGLDWQETYLALLDDLGVQNIKLLTHWDLLELAKDEYYFDDLQWQIEEAEKRNAKIILVVGMKTGRWPECHIPDWAQTFSKEDQQKAVLNLVKHTAQRYGDSEAIRAWQVENEPFFPFGNCPWSDKEFVKKEIELIKSLDSQNRPVIVSETGEFSLWTRAARLADVVGITMYRRVWSKEFGMYVNLPFPSSFYTAKSKLIEKVFNKKVIVIELQAEPWGPKLLYDSPFKEQAKSMDIEQFGKNIEFAKRTGLDEFYLWGVEWWYWMKEKQDEPEFWQSAKNLFKERNE